MQDLVKEKNNQLIHSVRKLIDPSTPLGAQLRVRRLDDHTVQMGLYTVNTDPQTQTHSVHHRGSVIVENLHWFHSATVIIETHIRNQCRYIPEICQQDQLLNRRYHDLLFLNHVLAHADEQRVAALSPRRHWIRQQLEQHQRAICKRSVLLKKLSYSDK